MTGPWIQTERAIGLLRTMGFEIESDEFLRRCSDFHRLCSTWNLSAKLMSRGDLETKFDEHVADSLSLVSHVRDWFGTTDGVYVDVGAGGGFPAIPIKLAFPGIPLVLVERSARKSEFLCQAVQRLGLVDVQVSQAEFPKVPLPKARRIYTARATEQPTKVDAAIVSALRLGDLYIAERVVIESVSETGVVVTELHDAFTAARIRRGKLFAVRTAN